MRIVVLTFLLSSILACAAERIALIGEISQTMCDNVEERLHTAQSKAHIDLILSSSDGDLQAILHLARTCSTLIEEKNITLTACIREQCIGPAAILPLVCQNIIVTPAVSWGAITINMPSTETFSILESQIRAIIPPSTLDRVELAQIFIGSAQVPPKVFTQHDLVAYPGIIVSHDASRFEIDESTFIPKKKFESGNTTAFSNYIHLTPVSWIGRIVIDDKKQGISEATLLYIKAACKYFKEHKPACVILELDTPGGEVFPSVRISNALRSLDIQENIPVIAFVNNWAISAGAMLAYSCRFIVATSDASMGAATPVFQTAEGMQAAPEKVNSALRSEFANQASFFGRNPDIARAMVDPDIILVRRHGEVISCVSDNDIRKTDEVISAKGKLVTLTTKEMVECGIADFVIPKNLASSEKNILPIGQTTLGKLPIFGQFPQVPLSTFQMDAKTTTVAFLASPIVSSLLVSIAIFCFYIELSAPGVSIPGLIGAICLLLTVIGSFAQEAITWFEPLCVAIGLALIAVELTLFPTLGLLLIVGGLLALFGLASILLPGLASVRIEGNTINAAGNYVLTRFSWLMAGILLAIFAIIFTGKKLRSLKSLSKSGIVLKTPASSAVQAHLINVGDVAVVVATLRPSGKIELGDTRFDAISQGQFLEVGTKVRVVATQGQQIIVEPA